MKGPTTRGKIPLSDRPTIVARYESGESIASISRSFDCTAPAIRYLIKRTKGSLSRDSDASGRRTPASPALLSTLGIARTGAAAFSRNDLESSVRTIGKSRSGNFDRSLRDRISGDIAAFLVALDASTLDLSRLNIETLVEATDRLLQACARMRMELDRLRTLPSRVRPVSDREPKKSERPVANRRRRQSGKATVKSG